LSVSQGLPSAQWLTHRGGCSARSPLRRLWAGLGGSGRKRSTTPLASSKTTQRQGHECGWHGLTWQPNPCGKRKAPPGKQPWAPARAFGPCDFRLHSCLVWVVSLLGWGRGKAACRSAERRLGQAQAPTQLNRDASPPGREGSPGITPRRPDPADEVDPGLACTGVATTSGSLNQPGSTAQCNPRRTG